MTSHIHLVLRVDEGNSLSDVIRDFKSHTSRTLHKSIEAYYGESRREWLLSMFRKAGHKNSRNQDFQLWQQHNHPIVLDSNELLNQRIEYVHMNPVEAGFVFKPEDWIWSSARKDVLGESIPVLLESE
jgi:REP element-mobilizing transposase RayT